MNCADVEDCLVDFLEGELDAEDAGIVQRHLATCPACEAAARETRELLGDLSSARSVDGGQSGGAALELAGLGPGTVIADFRIIHELGRGGMGIVYRAEQVTLHREVALKVLSPALTQVPRAVDRFRREAQAAARLHHTNIVPVYAQGVADGFLFYAMELIDGQSLDAVIAEQRREGEQAGSLTTSRLLGGASSGGFTGRRDFRRVAQRMAGVADALAHAHEQGVIHRDIKPQNLIAGAEQRLHVTDFGLARLMDEPGLTLSRDLVGTPIYMAPEQVSGGVIDGRTDVYALGMTLYEWLTLRKPFEGTTYEAVIRQVLHSDPLAPRRVDRRIPVDLETICLRAIEKEPQRRFPSAAAMAADLRRYADQFPIESRRISLAGRLVRWTRRNPAKAAVVGLLVTVAALLPALTWFSQRRAEVQIESAWQILLADYHLGDEALAELGWLTTFFGDRDRSDLVQALARLLREPAASQRILEGVLARRDLADAHYLLAWAHRIQTASQPQAWKKVFAALEAGDEAAIAATAAGHFFKGIALIPLDPQRAEAAFEQAIVSRSNFTQAWLQQGRAIDQILYLYGGLDDYGLADEKYRKGVQRLQSAAQLARQDSYPSYLLSNAHRFAALLAQRTGRAREAEERFAACLEDARAAQRANPANAHGFSAEAFYHEARGDYSTAIALWEQVAQRSLRAHQVLERAAYQMRLHYWRGEFDDARRMHAIRYSAAAGYDPDRYDADEALFAALIAAGGGDRAEAERIVREAGPRVETTGAALLHAAACDLLGVSRPAGLLDGLTRDASVPPRWPVGTIERIVACLNGEISGPDLVASRPALLANLSPDERRLATPFLLAGLHFYAGVRYVGESRYEQAERHFEAAGRMHDGENYCFRGAFLSRGMALGVAPWPKTP